MKQLLNRKLLFVLIGFLVLLLVTQNTKINKYKEFTNNSIITSYTNITRYAYMMNQEIEEILRKKEITKQDLEKVFIYNRQMIGELYFIQTSMLTLNRTDVISYEKYDVIRDLEVKISKKNNQIIELEEEDLKALNQLNKVCLNITETLRWDELDIVKNDLWISILKELNDRSIEYLKK